MPLVGWLMGSFSFSFEPYFICYSYEIFDNFRRLKPNATEDAAKAGHEFLMVSMVVGIVGVIAGIVLMIAAIFFLSANFEKPFLTPHAYRYHPSMMETSTVTATSTSVGTSTPSHGL